jgi:hypothetical protein
VKFCRYCSLGGDMANQQHLASLPPCVVTGAQNAVRPVMVLAEIYSVLCKETSILLLRFKCPYQGPAGARSHFVHHNGVYSIQLIKILWRGFLSMARQRTK